MAIQRLRTSPEAPDFDEAASLTYEQAPDYDQEAIDPDYDESSQGEFTDDFTGCGGFCFGAGRSQQKECRVDAGPG